MRALWGPQWPRLLVLLSSVNFHGYELDVRGDVSPSEAAGKGVVS
jgi:hypothetical protein